VSLPALDLQRDNVRVVVGEEAAHVIRVVGVLRQLDDRDWLAKLITEWHEAAVAGELPEIVLDLRELEYANSATWKCLATWVRLLSGDARALYTLRIRARDGAGWQRVGLGALQIFGGPRLIVQ
jgi:hypothetical protein